ncbi:hypothetical protein B0H10DRAFT_1969808 [Mycena sp. CBHHK59/15]|nr:hypothetical protein B0H10DRAFT_1969808 [Mycena sp. CBHHK59/15]
MPPLTKDFANHCTLTEYMASCDFSFHVPGRGLAKPWLGNPNTPKARPMWDPAISTSKWLEILLIHLHHAVGLTASVAPGSGPSGEHQGESTTQWAPAASGKLRTGGPAASTKGGLPCAGGFMKGRNKHENIYSW